MLFEAIKANFLEGCKPFIRLDDCYLKGPHVGSLSAVILDVNRGVLPLVFAFVESEWLVAELSF